MDNIKCIVVLLMSLQMGSSLPHLPHDETTIGVSFN
jgi:hypothetical protein